MLTIETARLMAQEVADKTPRLAANSDRLLQVALAFLKAANTPENRSRFTKEIIEARHAITCSGYATDLDL